MSTMVVTNNSARKTARRSTVERVEDAQAIAVDLPGIGRVRIPHAEQLAFYGAVGAMAAFGIIDWPVALVIVAGHALARRAHSKVAQELGKALEKA